MFQKSATRQMVKLIAYSYSIVFAPEECFQLARAAIPMIIMGIIIMKAPFSSLESPPCCHTL